MKTKKFLRVSDSDSSVTLHGNWGNPALESGADFCAIYLNIDNGQQGALPADRHLKCDSYNNSFISKANPDFSLRHTTGKAFIDVTIDDYNGATDDGNDSLGKDAWYTYGPNGFPTLVSDFVFYISDNISVWAFAADSFEANGVDANNQGVFNFNVRKLQ